MQDTGAALDGEARELVLRTMREVCRHQQWTLYAAHVRRSHVHMVVRAEVAPEEVMRKLKAYGGRALNRRFGFREKRWVRHGSTRRLWSPAEVDVTVDYVVWRQGEPMAVYENRERWSEVLR